LIPAGTGLAYHEARKRAAVAGGVPQNEAPAVEVIAAEEVVVNVTTEVSSEIDAEWNQIIKSWQ